MTDHRCYRCDVILGQADRVAQNIDDVQGQVAVRMEAIRERALQKLFSDRGNLPNAKHYHHHY